MFCDCPNLPWPWITALDHKALDYPEGLFPRTSAAPASMRMLQGTSICTCASPCTQAGCTVSPDYFKVMPCGALNAVGGYSQQHGVILCQDQLHTRSQVASTALHELLHAYDDCRAGSAGLDWADCRAHACAEVCPGLSWALHCCAQGVWIKLLIESVGGMGGERGGSVSALR